MTETTERGIDWPSDLQVRGGLRERGGPSDPSSPPGRGSTVGQHFRVHRRASRQQCPADGKDKSANRDINRGGSTPLGCLVFRRAGADTPAQADCAPRASRSVRHTCGRPSIRMAGSRGKLWAHTTFSSFGDRHRPMSAAVLAPPCVQILDRRGIPEDVAKYQLALVAPDQVRVPLVGGARDLAGGHGRAVVVVPAVR